MSRDDLFEVVQHASESTAERRGRTLSPMLTVFLFVLPLALDTFAVAAALGIGGLPKRQRLRLSLVMASFEMAMPVLGLLIGHGLGSALGGVANYVAAAALVALGGWMLLGHDDSETERVEQLSQRAGIALVALGVSISLDELAIGFSIGLIHLSLVVAVIAIGAQAFIASQIGLRIGARLGEATRERAERLAAIALIGLGAFLLVEKLTT
jgi:putative Mn2+ efflux pump MntP